MGKRQVSMTRTIAAAPEKIFSLLTDPAQHPILDGSGSVRAVQSGGPERLELGSRFGMDMKLGASYKILNTVVEFEPNRLIAWRHFNGHRWRWQLKPVAEDKTEVTETFDWSTAKVPLLITLSTFPQRNKAAIDKTLDNLAEIFPA
jgi:uncharacterized protein YndB with AHSA1/START domain